MSSWSNHCKVDCCSFWNSSCWYVILQVEPSTWNSTWNSESKKLYESATVEFYKSTFKLPGDQLVACNFQLEFKLRFLDCSCSLWHMNHLRKGGLYISVTHFSFFSPSEKEGKNTDHVRISIPWEDVTSVIHTARRPTLVLMTSLLVPFSIRIMKEQDEYYFTDFTSLKVRIQLEFKLKICSNLNSNFSLWLNSVPSFFTNSSIRIFSTLNLNSSWI